MMRKLKAFSKAQVYFSDCAATAGGQVVIAPNGQVGICHGCLHDKKYFVSNVDDKEFNAIKDELFSIAKLIASSKVKSLANEKFVNIIIPKTIEVVFFIKIFPFLEKHEIHSLRSV